MMERRSLMSMDFAPCFERRTETLQVRDQASELRSSPMAAFAPGVSSVWGTPTLRQGAHLMSMSAPTVSAGQRLTQPRIGRHVRLGNDVARVRQVRHVPFVGITAANAMQIGAGTLWNPTGTDGHRQTRRRPNSDRSASVSARNGRIICEWQL